ncbi:MAG TPA: CsgG/HfaB family protein [Ramlibacter sp.]|uniref:CsgG/HfaB family protein n=1 Tax=Ramlibacter sp. TaxID=1917967 RepID=UPI002BB5355B|nr:CsgG/HfaB family protein [Ramlibacter sp.]HVZ42276.1 CsgG/HfaB family protein [Ramlibacter sp.]
MLFAVAGTAALLSGCANLPAQKMAPDEFPVITGSMSRRNYTPIEPAFACLADLMRLKRLPPIGIAVGDVKDYTGKYSQNEGNAITQGGALMIYSALGKMGDVVQLQERFDTRIAELELAYTDRRQLGDGRQHTVETGKPAVPWVPYYGGTILKSQYYIVGGITELNYNIASGGAEVYVNGVGAKKRTFTMNIGVDLRIVDTRSLVVVRTASVQKQIIGEEVGVGVYRFFGTELVDVNGGNKNQEPLQLGVRTTIEHGVVELVAAVSGIDPMQCIDATGVARATPASLESEPAALPAPVANGNVNVNGNGHGAQPVAATPPPEGLAPQNAALAPPGPSNLVPFEFGSDAISVQAASVLEKVAAEAAQGRQAVLQLLARDNEVWAPSQRRELTNARVKSVTDFLVSKGVASSRVGVTWVPAPTDQQITRHSAGFQLVATMVVAQ